MILQYPITGLAEGWYFRREEASAGSFVVEACDSYGRKISRQGVGDPEAAIAECVQFAREINQREHGIAEQGCSSEHADCDAARFRGDFAAGHSATILGSSARTV